MRLQIWNLQMSSTRHCVGHTYILRMYINIYCNVSMLLIRTVVGARGAVTLADSK